MVRMNDLALAALLVLAAAVPGWAQSYGSFRVEWESMERGAQGALVTGYVHNDYGVGAGNIRLLVESMDDRGTVVRTAIGSVLSTVPPLGRVYFEVPLSSRATGYRVRVLSFDWLGTGG